MNRRLFVRIGLFALAHFFALVLLDNFIFLLSHLPPQVLHFDALILALTGVERVLTAPRWLLRHVWLSERTPAVLNWLLVVLNSLIWGAVLNALASWWKAPPRGN
jgi:hypothetical protein